MLKAFENGVAEMKSYSGAYAYIEALVSQDNSGRTQHKVNMEALSEDELEDWAWQRLKYAPDSTSKLLGGVKVLFAQTESSSVHAIPSALGTAKIIEALQLPRCTFHSFQRGPGVFSIHTQPDHVLGNASKQLGLLFRTPQRWKCSLGMFAVSHNFDARMTTALSLGHAFDLDKYDAHAPPTLANFAHHLMESSTYWTHPLLLPCMFLAIHALRVETYLQHFIGPEVVAVKECIGVTRAGTSQPQYSGSNGDQSQIDQGKLFVNGRLHRSNAQRLTHKINDLSTWIIFTKRSPKWDIDCATFLLRLIDTDPRLQVVDGTSVKCLQEALHYVRNDCEASLENVESSEAQLKLQLEILYTSIAQDDGQTSVRIAASAGKDSTSMKIIAVITAAYLPGTFIATLFSMGMFSWQSPDANSSGSRASSDFWIYWAVTIPLTVITIAGWAIWWKFEMFRSNEDIQTGSRGSPMEGIAHRPSKPASLPV